MADHPSKKIDVNPMSTGAENAKHQLGACPDDSDSDLNYDDDDDDDDYEDDYYGDESLSRTAEVQSCGRLQH